MTVANDFLTQTARNSQNFAVHFVFARPDGVGADLVSARGDATANRCHSGLFILSDGHAYFMIGTQIVRRADMDWTICTWIVRRADTRSAPTTRHFIAVKTY